jgi:hypothetical protein
MPQKAPHNVIINAALEFLEIEKHKQGRTDPYDFIDDLILARGQFDFEACVLMKFILCCLAVSGLDIFDFKKSFRQWYEI